MTRVTTPQVRASRSTVAASAPASTGKSPAALSAEKASWGAGAGKTAGLRIASASIDEGPKTTTAVVVPKGFKAELKTVEVDQKATVHGTAVSLEQHLQDVVVTAPGGKQLRLGNAAEQVAQLTADWKAEVAASKKAPRDEWMQLSWSADQTFSGAGTAGKLFSVLESYGSYMGGAHPNHASKLATYDASTGKQVKLDALLSQQQMNALVKDIAKRLPELKDKDTETDGTSFTVFSSPADMREVINSNFSISADKSGKVFIDVAWESGIHALGGMMAHFRIEAPTDPAFRKAAGLE